MTDTGSTLVSPAGNSSTLVVLLTCEMIGDFPDVSLLRDTVLHAEQSVRVLMLVTDNSGLALARSLSEAKVQVELLLGAAVSGDLPDVPFARMPPHIKPTDQEDFALALADVVIADPMRHHHPSVRRAEELGKPLIAPGRGLPLLPRTPSVTDGLDPLALKSHGWRRHVAGRLEQAVVEFLALFGVQEQPLAEIEEIAKVPRRTRSVVPVELFCTGRMHGPCAGPARVRRFVAACHAVRCVGP